LIIRGFGDKIIIVFGWLSGKGIQMTIRRLITNKERSSELKMLSKLLIVLIAMGGLIPSLALADFPAGQWTMTSYSEVNVGPKTDGICIQDGGTWYSDTFSGWSGKWFRKGNDIHLHGNYSTGDGNTAFELTLINFRLLTGYLQEWRDRNPLDYNFARVQFIFQKASCNPSR
jgi:hypothetical protein